MPPRPRDQRSAPRPQRPAHPRCALPLAIALPWLGTAALWACTGWPLLSPGGSVRSAMGGAAALAALVLSAGYGLRAHRAVVHRCAALHAWARQIADRTLPEIAEQLNAGDPIDPAQVIPAPGLGRDRLGRAAAEIVAAQRAAVALAIRQADARKNVRAVFLNLSRRTQALIHRQLAVLDTMEREHEDPDLLHQLFAVDHLSTRLRRHAENLVILGGALPPRLWRHGVSLMDVVRSAVSETEEYTRVEVEKLPVSNLRGHAVADVVHLLAELLENGCTFSPPHTQVTVNGEEVSHGVVLEIEDRGLGMTDEQYHRVNAALAPPADFDSGPLGSDGRLGMFVVGRLAHRHGVGVQLRRSPYGGTRVIVLLPRDLLDGPAPAAADGGPAPAGNPPRVEGGDTGAQAGVAYPAAGGAEWEPGPAAPQADEPTPDTPRVLPKRVKRASVAAQLRELAALEEALGTPRPEPRPGPGAGSEPSPADWTEAAEAARATMSAIQQATRLARDTEPGHTEPYGAHACATGPADGDQGPALPGPRRTGPRHTPTGGAGTAPAAAPAAEDDPR